MSRDLSDGSSADMHLLRTSSALIAGREAIPPTSNHGRALLDLARAHRIERLVVRSIRMRGDDLSTWFHGCEGDLPDERADAALDVVRQRELRRVLDRLADIEGAAPVLFKGAALAQSHYPDPWLRPRLDADILISPSRVKPATAALEELGYERAVSTSGTLVSSQMSLSRVDTFGVEHALDVHWNIANRHVVASVLSHDEVASRAVSIPAFGPRARAAADVDALLIGCLHRAVHHRDSEELLWIFDLHLLAQRLSHAEWISFLATVHDRGVTAICGRGLRLAIEWFNSPVPADVLRDLDGDHAGPEASAVFLSKRLRLVDNLSSDLRALPVRGRVRLLVEHLFPPVSYIRRRYQVTSRVGVAIAYLRRIVAGVPRWLAARSNS